MTTPAAPLDVHAVLQRADDFLHGRVSAPYSETIVKELTQSLTEADAARQQAEQQLKAALDAARVETPPVGAEFSCLVCGHLKPWAIWRLNSAVCRDCVDAPVRLMKAEQRMNDLFSDQSEDMTGVELIAQERQRQFDAEGWTPAHDDAHDCGEMGQAAICYIDHAAPNDWETHPQWPWEPSWWKPSDDPIRDLTKAGALIAAEIDRLQRAARVPPPQDAAK